MLVDQCRHTWLTVPGYTHGMLAPDRVSVMDELEGLIVF
jgi:hypothetical protein